MKKDIFEELNEVAVSMNDISIGFVDEYYDSDARYICDAISEHADSNTSIYYPSIIQFISNHVEEVNEAIEEFGWDGCGGDLYKAGQMAEFMCTERELYDDLYYIIKASALKLLLDAGVHELEEDDFDRLMDEVSLLDNNDGFDDIREKVDELLEELEEREEEEEEEETA